MYSVAFYSYKGGVGRSLLVANSALYLAQLGLRVVALDLDLEAPGLHYKFAAAMPRAFAVHRGVVDLIFNYATRNELYESLRDVAFEVPLGEQMLAHGEPPQGSLHVIPAGASPSPEYWQHMASIDWKRFLYDEQATGLEFFLDLRDRIAAEFAPDVLLIDSRTGITEIGNVATSVLADKVVCIVADSDENLDGSREVLRGLRRHRRLSDGAPLEMMIAVSRPHPSIPLSNRLDKIRTFLEEPAEMLDATLSIGVPYPLTHSTEMEQRERLVFGGSFQEAPQLGLDYMAIAEDLVPEALWSNISIFWSPAIQSPYPYSIWNYSRLVLENPNIEVDGLYRVGRRCFIVVPGLSLETRAADGRLLSEWLVAEKTAGLPMELVDRIPDNAVRVPDPSLSDLVELRDLPRSSRGVDMELALKLPRTFPKFTSGGGNGASIVVEVERALRPDENVELRRALASLHYNPLPRPLIRVNPAIAAEDPRFQRSPQGDVDLIPSRRLTSTFSKVVRDLVARDEDLWMSSRLGIHQGIIKDPSAVLPAWRAPATSRLLAGSQAFAVTCVRRLLPFCEQLVITLPAKDRVDEVLAEAGFTREELVVLAAEGRLVLLLPQSAELYEPALLDEVAQRAPESLVLSRTLCAATMIELRRRLYPWFFPGFDLRERRERLRRVSIREVESPLFRSLFSRAAFSSSLGHVWAREEWHTHTKGALGTRYLGGGFSTLLAAHVEHALHRDLTIEASEAGPSVEIAAALGAALVPMHRKEFSMLGLAKMGAGLLSRLSGASVGSVPSFVLDLPDTDFPAMELARLHGEELWRIRDVVAAMARGASKAASGEPEAIAACRRMLIKAGALKRPSGKLRLAAPELENPDSYPSQFDVATGMLLARLHAAGERDTIEASRLIDDSPDLPSIVVGELTS